MRDANELDPRAVGELLQELRLRLIHRGVNGQLRVVGGAALALHFPDDPDVRVTKDIDALYWPKSAVDEVVREIAVERGLPVDWLNDRARPWAPRDADRGAVASFTVGNASLEEMVAMKLSASREQDLHDLEILARHMNITAADALVQIAYDQYGEDSMALTESREEYLLIAQQVLDSVRRGRRQR